MRFYFGRRPTVSVGPIGAVLMAFGYLLWYMLVAAIFAAVAALVLLVAIGCAITGGVRHDDTFKRFVGATKALGKRA